jgi:ubiquinol-cytochrome c reductase cytochrome b subunit
MLRRAWQWFDDLTGTSALLHPILFHLVPKARKSAWLYVFGSATLFVFLVQVVTGVALSSAYVASAGQAYETLKFISGSRFGSIVRGIHYFGASAMVILVGVHAIRVYLMASYKYPRQMNWLSGVLLLFLTLGMAFTGQLLRWDQDGFWSAVVAAAQGGKTPVVGNWLGHFILAGDTAGGATLSRFFAAHVFFIPAMIFLFLALHLYLVIRNGISEPPKTGRPVDPRTYRVWYKELLARDGEPFWPDAAWRDAVFGSLVILTIVALAIAIGPEKLGRAPDPTLIGASPKPDWYLLWYYALLSVIPRWSEDFVILVAPLLFAVLLLSLPFIANRGERSPLRRPWSMVAVATILVVIFYFGRLGVRAPWSPRLEAERLPAAVVGTEVGPVAQGAKVFYNKGCEFCHLVDGHGGIRGPDLSDAGDRMTGEQMTTRIFSGAANMPSYRGNMSPEDLSSLIAFLESRHRVVLSLPPVGPIPGRP